MTRWLLALLLLLSGPAFAGTSITALPAASAADGTETLPVDQAGVTSKMTTAQVKTYTSAAPTITGHPVVEGVTSTGATGTGKFVFDASPTLTGHPTFEGVTSTGATGTGKLVYDGTPTLVTPVLGVATATSVNKVTITAPASSAVLTIPDGVTLTGPASSGTAMTLGNTETVTGVKTFGSAGAVGRLKLAGTTSGTTVLDASATASGTLTLPALTDTLAVVGTNNSFTAAQTISFANAAASTDGALIATTTAATVGAQKWSPRLHYQGFGWGTTAGTSQSVDLIEYLKPIQSTVPTHRFVYASAVAGGAYTDIGYLDANATPSGFMRWNTFYAGTLDSASTRMNGTGFQAGSAAIYGFNSSSTVESGGSDTGLCRSAAGIVDVNTGTCGTLTNTAIRTAGIQGNNTVKALTESSATAFVIVTVPSNSSWGGRITYGIEANDASDYQNRSGSLFVSAVNKAGTTTCTVSTVDAATEVVAVSAGTLTNTMTCTDGGSGALNIKANAASSLTQTTLQIRYRVEELGTNTIAAQ